MTQTIQREWQDREFAKTLSDAKLPRRGKLQARDYRLAGKFPVVDQGQKYVSGWTDDVSLVIESGLPYIVFGDHTRAFKYVDQPFVLGADGTQLLKPGTEYNARFFYYACLQLDLPSRGYNRHFTFLKEKTLPLPPKKEQEKIAAVLWRLQRALATQDRLIASTRDLKQSAMYRLFTRGLRGEQQKETEIGSMPESWAAIQLGKVSTLSTGTTPATKDTHYYDGDIPFIKTVDVVNNRITSANTHLSQAAIDDYSLKLFPPGTVLMAMYGQGKTRGQVALLEIAAATTQNAGAIQPSTELDSAFLWHYLLSCYERLRGMGSLGHVSHLNLGYVRDLVIVKPPLDEQREIAAILDAIDRKLTHHQKKRAALNDLFQTLLHKLMTGEIRVADIDIDTSEITAPPGATS